MKISNMLIVFTPLTFYGTLKTEKPQKWSVSLYDCPPRDILIFIALRFPFIVSFRYSGRIGLWTVIADASSIFFIEFPCIEGNTPLIDEKGNLWEIYSSVAPSWIRFSDAYLTVFGTVEQKGKNRLFEN